ncbi:MAG: outer membrane assembly protein [Tannerellaceae bacterium]|nr:outer membrane assembly protein [Tannerellaceae bacterium]
MKNKKKFWIITISVLLFIIIGIPAIAFSVLRWGILPPEKLTPLVINEANKLLNGRFDCERIELTFFETYPRLGVRVYDGELISYAAKDSVSLTDSIALSTDTLLTFKRVLVSVNPLDYLFSNKITIGGVFLEDPAIHAYVNEKNVANWDVLRESSEEDEEEITPLPPIDLQRLGIKNGRLIFDDRQAGRYAAIDSLSVRLTGGLIEKGNKIELEWGTSSIVFEDKQEDMYAEVGGLQGKLKGLISTEGTGMKFEAGTSSILFESPAYTLRNNMSVDFKSIIVLTDQFNTVRLKGAEMMVNNLPFTAEGIIANQPDSNRMKVDLDLSLKASDMNDLLDFVPDEYFQDRKNMQAKGSVLLESSIHGFVGDSIFPTVNLCCKIEDASYFMKGVKQGIDAFEMDMDVHLNGTSPDSSYVVLENLRIEGLNTAFSLKARVDDVLQSPYIDAYMKGTIDFTRLAEEFLNPDTLLLRGKMDADLSASFLLDDLLDGRYNKVTAGGKLDIDELRTLSRSAGLYLYLAGAHFQVDTTKQTSSFLTNDDLLSAFLTVDSMSVSYKREINTNISNVDIQAKTSPSIDTAAVIPLTGHIKVGYLRTRMPDSVWVVAKNSHLMGGIKPSATNKKMPNLGAAITIDTLRYIDIPLRTGTTLVKSTFGIEALPYRESVQRRRESQQGQREARQRQRNTPERRQSSERVAGTSGTGTERQQAAASSSGQSSGLLRNWEVKGTLKFNNMRIFSRMFPLRMSMEPTTLRFDTNTITLTDATFHAGKSNFTLTGEVNSMRRAMLAGGKLRGNFAINSGYIDCNELLHALNQGLLYLEELESKQEKEALEDGTQADVNEDIFTQSAASIEVTDTTDVLLVIPDILDMTLKTKAKKIDYKDLELENVEGELVIRNQSVNLKKLSMDSNIGHGNLTMVYTAKDRMQGSAGFELEMEDIQVEKLIGLFPSIDSLLPMLRSFEGVVDCQMAATCELDSTMSVILPSLNSACYLSGQNMVLLDGETFAEISRTLMFKNKKRNLIDSISVDLSIRDNKIEIFPFLLEMDRYRVAVGGTHNLDMTFDYHLSVLKSPVPFKLGIDVTGNLDKFKYKITKCRYKDIFKPAYEIEMDATRTNLRAEIRNVIRNQMQANAPELATGLQFEENFSRRRENTNRPPRPKPVLEDDNEAGTEEQSEAQSNEEK